MFSFVAQLYISLSCDTVCYIRVSQLAAVNPKETILEERNSGGIKRNHITPTHRHYHPFIKGRIVV